MSQYIDAEKLKAEIERRLERYDPHYTNAGSELKVLLSFIESLEKEPKDLKKEVEEYYYKNFDMLHRSDLSTMEIVSNVARYFYELGRKSQAKQGASYETIISAHNGQPVLLMKDVFDLGFDYGDKVVVQIRKNLTEGKI